jgi:acetyltransferase-like isoleucine patch superfamily enzyme
MSKSSNHKPRFIGTGTLILGNVRFGKNVWVGHYCLLEALNEGAELTIGDNSVISSFVRIYTHDTSYRTALGKSKSVASTSIGSNTQICDGSVILAGVKVGSHVIIGANSVVNKDVPDYKVAAGVPIRIIKSLKG